ncbi:hypothetical protein ACFX2I_024041 [Malus domestica]
MDANPPLQHFDQSPSRFPPTPQDPPPLHPHACPPSPSKQLHLPSTHQSRLFSSSSPSLGSPLHTQVVK